MIRPRNLFRLMHIHRVLMEHGLDEIIEATHLFRPLSLIGKLNPFNWRNNRKSGPRGERIRLALIELGPIFVKFGQALSTRRDMLPLDIADELAKLQDQVPPFSGKVARQIAEKAYGMPMEEVFADFEEAPLAAASIAQVHSATLKSGQEVIIKLLRPGMREQISRDIDLLYDLARLARRYWPQARRFRPVEVVAEYEKTILDELDLMREAGNAAQLKRNFADSDLLYVPEVYWDLCKPQVMVMERIHGVPISEIDTLLARGTDMQVLAENGVEIFFTQVFRHNFFHADMHPGNIFVDISDPAAPRYVAVDFGIVGTLAPSDQHYLAENFLAFFKRDYHRVAKLHIDSGWVPADTRVDEFETAIRTVSEPIFNKPLKDISFGQFLVRLFDTARRFNMEVQPQLVLLQKTLLNIEGLGRQLYPELDLWKTAYPILEEWMKERISGRAALKRIRDQLPELGESLQEFPQLAQSLLQQASEGKLMFQVKVPELAELRREQREQERRRYWSTAAGAALIVSGVLIGLEASPAWPAWLLGFASALSLYLNRP